MTQTLENKKKESRYRMIHLIIGPLLFALCYFCLPASFFATAAARGAIGTIAWMAYWWITGPIPFAVTAFLPLTLNAIFQICDMKLVTANYADEIILLLLGASIITAGWEITGLDKRVASMFLMLIGNSLRGQVVFWFLLSTVLSAVLPNAVVCAAITPIAVAMLRYIGIHEIGSSKIGSMILMTIAYGAGVGGMATPLGGAMNLVTVEYLQQITGQEFIYMHWFVRFLPLMLILIVSNIVYLMFFCGKDDTLGGSREYFVEQYKSMGKMTRDEKWALGLFAVATILAFTRQFYQAYLPGLKPAFVFVTCAIILFLIPKKDGTRLFTWKEVERRVIWDLLYIFAGGLAAGTLINQSGAAEAIGVAMESAGMNGGFFTVLIIVSVTLLMSDMTSNTATAAVAMPIIISIVQGIGLNPIPYIYVATIGVNISYMLPTSIRAIPVGYGLEPKFMLKKGFGMSIMVILLMSVVSYLMLTYWPAFSTI
ncbi:MAG: SLC13 family permease [Firmicutes bacterium]|nr:SLC13 family permease [Bacillota bacterium]